jgi:beta-glucosidase
MSLKEKVGQMTQLSCKMLLESDPKYTYKVALNKTALIYSIREFGVGSFLDNPFSDGPLPDSKGNMMYSFTADRWLAFVNEIQQAALQYGNSSVPMIYGLDSVHGANYVLKATIFPHNIGQAATWDPFLSHLAARVSAKDTSAAGIPWAFSPVLGLGVQPLWPRFYETFGEDPYLISAFARGAIEGYMGKHYSTDPLISPNLCKPHDQENAPLPTNFQSTFRDTVAPCIKHYIGYTDPISGKDRSDAWIPDRMLLQYFAPSFISAVRAGANTAMINSGSVNGIPVHSSKPYITDLLRNQMNFQGFIVSDWQDIEKLVFYHHVASNDSEAISMALDAGVEMSMVPMDYNFPTLLYSMAKNNPTLQTVINKAVTNILGVKYDLGLFKDPFYSNASNPNLATVGSAEDRNISTQIVRESVTLLVNNNSALPLNPQKYKNILVAGPSGSSLTNQCGGWTLHWQGAENDLEFGVYEGTSTIFQGIQDHAGSNAQVVYEQGCSFTDCKNLGPAYQTALGSDLIVLAVGEAPESEDEGDINDLTLSAPQITLIRNITKAVGVGHRANAPPVVLVLVEPRPRILPPDVVQSVTAILHAYLPGPYAGDVIGEILFGITNPSGRLPFTYPRHTGDIRVPYWHRYSATTKPLFPFGYGLSYTTFQYQMSLSTQQLVMGQNLTVSVTVSNVGKVPGKEVVQLYVSDIYASVAPSVKQLKRFTKSSLLQPNQNVKYVFVLTPADFAFYGRDNTAIVEPGLFTIAVGDQHAEVTLLGNKALPLCSLI